MRKLSDSRAVRRFLYVTFAGALVALASGCSMFHVNGTSTPPTVSITANPTSVDAGGTATLTVTATDATQVTVSGTDGSSYTLNAAGGTQSVTPTQTTTYTATATGTGGQTQATAMVTVNAPPPPTVSITANPTTIASGSSSTLTITATNATQVTVSGTDGSSYTLQPNGGTQTVSPTSTTTYTATASGTGGKAIASATVTVSATPPPGAPTVNISANPTTIGQGSSSTLTVTATNATQVTVTGTDGSSYTLQPTGGTQSVSPSSTTTYTATATGSGGSAKQSVTVTVSATAPPPNAPTVSIAANPSTIAQGSSSTLTVTATNATQVTVTGTDGSSYTLAPTGGTQTVTPASTTTYTATATGSAGSAKQSVTVTVNPPPPPPAAPAVSITANPTTISAGSSSTLTVTATNATQVTVTGTDGSSYTLAPTGGTQKVSPTSTTTYTATATGTGGTAKQSVTVTVNAAAPTITITANPTTITAGSSSTLTVAATNANQVTVTGSDGSSYTLQPSGGTQSVTPASTTTYTATATGASTNATATATVTVQPAATLQSIQHVVFMLQENHTFDNYFGMLNVYRHDNNMFTSEDGNEYDIDGLVGCAAGAPNCDTKTYDKTLTVSNPDDEGTSYSLFKLKSTCIDDDSSDWLASYGDVNRYNFLATRPIDMNGFVHTAEGYAKSCNLAGATCSGQFTDTTGQRAMGYYDDSFLNYYYYMASQFAVDDRWFSPMSSKSIDNRIATFSGGTTQGLTKDPGNDHLPQLDIETIFKELDTAGVSWKIYYSVTQGFCQTEDDCPATGNARYPATDFSSFSYSTHYLYNNPTGAACTAPTIGSSNPPINDSSNSFCIDPNHIAPLSQYFTDLANGTLPSFAFIEAGYGNNDEHPGSGQSVLFGQAQVANIINSLMSSTSWSNSVFFLSYDEGGGPYDHVPPVPNHSNDNTDPSLGTIPDISSIAVNPDSYFPCVPPTPGTPTTHCDLTTTDPGANPADAPAQQGFAAQLGFRVPNMVISPFTKKHYVSHIPMDHTAVIKFVENRFIGSSAHLTARDAAQPNLLDFFDFTNVPWATPPSPPTPYTDGGASCTPASMGP
ncbi:MAG: alkaline phosphatase family protein [Acidobacteriota bacterium]